MPDDTPRRRAADRDRRRWSDDRLDDLAEQLRALGPSVGQLIRIEARLASVAEDTDDFKRWISEVETRLRTDLQRERDERQAAEERQKAFTERVETACSAAVDRINAGLTAKVNARAMVTVGAISAAATILAGKL